LFGLFPSRHKTLSPYDSLPITTYDHSEVN
jgi:hypothetical protein